MSASLPCLPRPDRRAAPGTAALWMAILGLGLIRVLPHAAPIVSLDYRVVGTQLRASPTSISVPKNIAGSILVEFVRGDGTPAPELVRSFGEDARIEATLRGPSYPARQVVGEPGKPLLLPALRLPGTYQLDDITLVRGGERLLSASPSSIPVHVLDEILVSRVTSRPLSLEEIREKGIVVDASNFRAVQFDVTLVLRGRSFLVHLPVVAPAARLSTELIPVAELEDRTLEAERINRELAATVALPPEIKVEMPEFTLRAINFEEVGDGDDEERKGIPITGLLVIPGNIGYLNQFFSVQLYTENVAPVDSGLVIHQLRASLDLPAGNDGLRATSHDQPGDDPLRMARVGPNRVVSTNLPVVLAGPDGALGTPDDVARLHPGDTGTAEFLVEGLREGLHLLDIQLEGQLEGLAAGATRIRGRAAGSILVRNPRFSFTFAHPRTVRAGEPYEAAVTLLNTGDTIANLARISLNKLAISGAVLLSPETIELGNLKPGDSATATFRLRSQRTGSVYFSNLTTSEDSVQGRLTLFTGVDERGVALSPDSIGYPEWVGALPEGIRNAANRVLGQALSVATAGRLPDGVLPISQAMVQERVVELAEAGQRLRYDDVPARVFFDLALDWQGGRRADPGFDQIVRTTDAGREWREAVAAAQESADVANASGRIRELAPSLAGLGASWLIAGSSTPDVDLDVRPTFAAEPDSPRPSASLDRSTLERSVAYLGLRGAWFAGPLETNRTLAWTVLRTTAQAEFSLLRTSPDGTAELLVWGPSAWSEGDLLEFTNGGDDVASLRRRNIRTPLTPTRHRIAELPPAVLSARQDIAVESDRHPHRCPIREYGNWGTVLALLFNKPMRPEDVSDPALYQLPDGNGARAVQLQPGGRVCLLQLHRGIGSFHVRPRDYALSVASVNDPRGHPSVPGVQDVRMTPATGTSVRGRVLGLDGAPAAGVPVTLTMHDRVGNKCLVADYRAGQVFTDTQGYFTLDFVLADVPFTVAAVDTRQMTDEDARAVLRVLLESTTPQGMERRRLEELATDPHTRDAMLRAFHQGDIGEAIVAAESLDRATYDDAIPRGSGRDGSELAVALRFRGRGSVVGRVVDARGVPLGRAAVNLHPAADSRELGRGVSSSSEGRFEFRGIPLGEFSVSVETSDGRCRLVADRLTVTGETRSLEIGVPDVRETFGAVQGVVTEVDGSAHPGARVYLAAQPNGSGVVASATTDGTGAFSISRAPAREWVLIAISADGRRRALRNGIRVPADAAVTLHLALEATTTVRGIVRYWDGAIARGARVGGGDRVVCTGDDGRFELTGVPYGARTIVAGVDAEEARDHVTRIGNAGVLLVPGRQDDIEIRLAALGRIQGIVFDATGTNRIPNIRVAIPTTGGFFWVTANPNGEYQFNGMNLGPYVVSAPSPPVKPKADELAAAALDAVGAAVRGDGGIGEASALVQDLASLYSQGTMARLAAPDFNPGSWGFTETSLDFDGQTVNADIRLIEAGYLSGTVLNHQGVPIGADVSVRAFGPGKAGAPTVKDFTGIHSHPETGAWSASGFLVGQFSAMASSPLLVGAATVEGTLTPLHPQITNVVLQFPPQRAVTGPIQGFVYDPDNSPVTNASVHISLAPDYLISTDDRGFFDTQIRLPALDYTITATNPASGLIGQTALRLVGGVTNFTTVHLLDKGVLDILVLRAGGTPAPRAEVTLTRFTFPAGARESIVTGPDGRARLEGLWEGEWTLAAGHLDGDHRIEARTSSYVERGRTNAVVINLGPSGGLAGRFREESGGTPIAGAQVAIRRVSVTGPIVATAPTDAQGTFRISGLPLDRYVITAIHPVSGRIGTGAVDLVAAGETRNVDIREHPLGFLGGIVRTADGTNAAPGVRILYEGPPGLSPSRSLSSGPDGTFVIPGVPLGPFRLSASDPVTERRAFLDGELNAVNGPLHVDLVLSGVGGIDVSVLEADGVTPATNATVRVIGTGGFVADTDRQGLARLRELPLGTVSFTVGSRQPGQLSSIVEHRVTLQSATRIERLAVRLPGVGRLHGRVLDASAQPAGGASVLVNTVEAGTVREHRTTVTDAGGSFTFEDLPLGEWRLKATLGALAAHGGGTFRAAGETAEPVLTLGGAGSIRGTLARESGGDIRGEDVGFFFTTQDGQPGFVRATSDNLSRFEGVGLPVGTPIELRVNVSALSGLAFVSARLDRHGQVLDVGEVRLDETAPFVERLSPPDGSTGLDDRPTLEVIFSEPIVPTSLSADGILLNPLANRSRVPLNLSLADRPGKPLSVLTLVPGTRLASGETYELVILGADDTDAGGRPRGLGPRDRARRPLPRSVTSRFTVRDTVPPAILAEFPTNRQADVEPFAPVRFEFNEPIDTNRVRVALVGPAGAIPGRLEANANLRILAYLPDRPLLPDLDYRVELTGVADLAGNVAPAHTNRFSTLDTRGPAIAVFRLAAGQRPVANATVTVEAVLADPEPGVVVRFARAGQELGLAPDGPPFRFAVRLPSEGRVRLGATAVDRAGNAGETAGLEFDVTSNDRPTLVLQRIEPAEGALPTGHRFSFAAIARDDATVALVRVTASEPIPTQRDLVRPTNGVPIPVVFELPSDTTATGPWTFRAVAIDDLGAESDVAVLAYEIEDATPPVLEVTAPAAEEPLDPRQPLSVAIRASDNSTLLNLTLAFSGALEVTNRILLAMAPGLATNLTVALPLAAAPEGGPLQLQVSLSDQAGNTMSYERSYRLRNVLGPRLRSIQTSGGIALPTTNILSPWTSTLTYQFDRPIVFGPTSTNAFRVTRNPGIAVPFQVQAFGSTLTLTLEGLPLAFGATYTATVLPGLTDATGTPVQLADGSPIPASGHPASFPVARLDGWTTPITQVVPGQTFSVEIRHERPFAPWVVALNGVPQPQPFFWSEGVRVHCTLPTNATSAVLTAHAGFAGLGFHELPQVDLVLRPRSGDEDRDGLPNGWEADHSYNDGLDAFHPFDPRDAALDFDHDQLLNRDEFLQGTDPFRADSDGDGLVDGSDIGAGGCPSPLNPDSDGDGIRDGDDPAPCTAGESIVLEPVRIGVTEGTRTTHRISARAEGLTLFLMQFADEASLPGFVRFADFSAAGTNPIHRELLLHPSYTDAGSHTVMLTLMARREFTVVTTNIPIVIEVADQPQIPVTRWRNPVSGRWHSPSNWTAGVPGVGLRGIIDAPGTYDVVVDQDAFVESVILGSDRGTPRLLLERGTFDINGASEIGPNGVLEHGAGFGSIAGQGELRVRGGFRWSQGTVDGSGLLRILPGGQATIGPALFPSFIYVLRPIENGGSATFGTNVTVVLGNQGWTNLGTGTLRLTDAQILPSGTSPSLVNHGRILREAHTDGRLSVQHFEQRGTLISDGGALSIEAATASFGPGGTNAGSSPLEWKIREGIVDAPLNFPAGIRIDYGILSNRVAQSWPAVSIVAGDLTGPGPIQISSRLEARGYRLGTPDSRITLLRDATAEFPTSAGVAVAGLFECLGETHLAVNTTVWLESGTFINRGRMVVDGPASFFGDFTPDQGFENEGLLSLRQSGTVQFISLPLLNSGTIDIEAGTLLLRSRVDHRGLIKVGAGAELSFNEDAAYPAGSRIEGAGTLEFNAGSHDLAEPLALTGPLRVLGGDVRLRRSLATPGPVAVRGGSLAFDADQELPALQLEAGTISGPGGLRVTKTFEWASGSLKGPGAFTIGSNAVATASRAAVSWFLGRNLTNHGELLIDAACTLYMEGVALHNLGRWIQNGDLTARSYTSISNLVINDGSLRTGTNDFQMLDVPLLTRGIQEPGTGPFRLHDWTNHTQWLVPAGGSLSISGDSQQQPGSLLGGPGALDFQGGQHLVRGAFAPAGPFTLRASRVEILPPFTNAAPVRLENGTVLLHDAVQWRDVTLDGATLSASSQVRILRELDWRSGAMTGSGSVRLDPTATTRVHTFSDHAIGLRLENAGVATLTNATVSFREGLWHALPGSLQRIDGTCRFLLRSGRTGVLNEGRLQKRGEAAWTLDVPLDSPGALAIDSGRVDVSESSTLRGDLSVAAGATISFGTGVTNTISAGFNADGTGSLEFRPGSTIELATDTDFRGLALMVQGNARVQGTGPLRSGLSGSLTFAGGFIDIATPIDVFGHMTVRANTTVRIDEALRIHPAATLENLGRRDSQNRSNIRVRQFPALGGTILGIPPDVVAAPGPLQRVARTSEPRATTAGVEADENGGVLFEFRRNPAGAAALVVEVSTDLQRWRPVPVQPQPDASGVTRFTPGGEEAGVLFYRVRELDW